MLKEQAKDMVMTEEEFDYLAMLNVRARSEGKAEGLAEGEAKGFEKVLELKESLATFTAK